MSTAVISSPIGKLKVEASDNQVVVLQFTNEPQTTGYDQFLQQVAVELREYFAGKRRSFDFPLAPSGTKFQELVWQELLKIPYGETISYRELANRLGQPGAVRAVAVANGKNPIVIAIPCHRVIGADGSLTGYAGGLERKKALLRLEGVDIFSQIDLFNEF